MASSDGGFVPVPPAPRDAGSDILLVSDAPVPDVTNVSDVPVVPDVRLPTPADDASAVVNDVGTITAPAPNGCAVRSGSTGPSSLAPSIALLALGLVIARRRRAASSAI